MKHKLFFSIALDDILIDDVSTGLCDDKDCLVTPDTGTSLLTFPSWAIKEFNKKYEKDKSEACESEFDYGQITYVINGIEYPLPAHHWMEMIPSSDDNSKGKCKHTISTLDVGQDGLDNLFIAGDYFMQIYYTVFDRNLDMVGLAKAIHTAPEVLNHWDDAGAYVDTQLVTEEDWESGPE